MNKTKVFAVRVRDKYDQRVEDYINSKISNVTWIRDELPGVDLQWNKLRVMNMDIDEPVLVIDIDTFYINDYTKAIDYPIERGEFLTAKSWWKDTWNENYSLCGGFQKYYPKDCKYIYDEFMGNINYWSQYYITLKITTGPVNGEQFFIEDQVKKKLKLKYLPSTWVTRMCNKKNLKELASINAMYPGEYVYLDGFHDDIKIVHFKNEEIDYSFLSNNITSL
jgi:hypothetical protein